MATVLKEDTLSENLIYDLRILEPYGEGFPEPVFGLKAIPNAVRYMGSDGQHVKLFCSSSEISIILWNKAEEINAYCVPAEIYRQTKTQRLERNCLRAVHYRGLEQGRDRHCV